jgi:hypothetical protein
MLECIKNVPTLTTTLNTVLGTLGNAKLLTPHVHFRKPNLNSHDLSKAYRNNNSMVVVPLTTHTRHINCNLETKCAIFFETKLNRNVDR